MQLVGRKLVTGPLSHHQDQPSNLPEELLGKGDTNQSLGTKDYVDEHVVFGGRWVYTCDFMTGDEFGRIAVSSIHHPFDACANLILMDRNEATWTLMLPLGC